MKQISYYADRTSFSLNAKLLVTAFLSALMFVFILFTGDKLGFFGNDLIILAVYFTLFYFAGMVIFFMGEDTDKIETIFFFAAAFAAVTYIRCSLMYFYSRDYEVFLSVWLSEMRKYSGMEALKANIGDYTMPYQYFLLILSKLKCNDLLLIKLFSVTFDIVGATYAMKLVGLKTKSIAVRALAFILTLAIPTVFLNSAMWGQCDMLFTAFGLAAIYYALKERGGLSVIMIAIAFSFKIQTIFFVPVMAVLFLIGKIKWRDLLWFPAVLFISVLPAAFAGRNPVSALMVYLHQTKEYATMHINATSIWCFIGDPEGVEFFNFNMIAIMLTGLAVAALIYLAYKYRSKLDVRMIVNIAFIGALLIPYLLPRMHDRYFFTADVLSLIYFFYNKNRWYIPIGVILSSYICYSRYLFLNGEMKLLWGAAILLVVLAKTLYDFVSEIVSDKVPSRPICAIDDNQQDFVDLNTYENFPDKEE